MKISCWFLFKKHLFGDPYIFQSPTRFKILRDCINCKKTKMSKTYSGMFSLINDINKLKKE